MQLDDRSGKLRSVESLNTAGWFIVGRSLVNRCPGFDISLVWSSRGCQPVTASRYVG